MKVDPLGILFTLIRISAAILLIIFFMSLWGIFGAETKANDLERFSAELYENIATSNLTFGKYVFDRDKLDDANFEKENFLDFIRDCEYKYRFEIENLKTGDKWEFGEILAPIPPSMAEYRVASQKEYYAGIVSKNPGKTAPFYEDAAPAKVTVSVSDTLTGRLACAIERAYRSGKVQTLQIKECLGSSNCVVFRRNGNEACFHIDGITDSTDCKILPAEIEFIDIAETKAGLRSRGVDTDKPLVLTAYPLKPGTTAGCGEIKNNPGIFLPAEGEKTDVVRVCATN